MTIPIRAKVLLYVWSYDFYDMTLSTEKTAMSYDNLKYETKQNRKQNGQLLLR